MTTKIKLNLRFYNLLFFFAILGTFLPNKVEACIDPDTVITVTANYNADFTEVAIVLGNLKFMTEAPNVFCSCSLASFSDFFTNIEYVAFVETGTTTPYPNMEPWENTSDADAAWNNSYPNSYGNWTGFIAEVINNGLGPSDDVELIIRASTPPGYFVSVSQIDSTLAFSYLGTDAWSPVDLALLGDHTGIRNLGSDNSSYVLVEKDNAFFEDLDGTILSTHSNDSNIQDLLISPNPNSGSFELTYSLYEASTVEFRLYDISGRLIYRKKEMPQSEGIIRASIQLPKEEISNGLYLFKILSENDHVIKKVFISS